MVTRPRRRPVVDRLRDAEQLLETERRIQAVHDRVCHQCHAAQDRLERRCDAGWASAKTEHRLQLRVEQLTAQAALESAQGTLW